VVAVICSRGTMRCSTKEGWATPATTLYIHLHTVHKCSVHLQRAAVHMRMPHTWCQRSCPTVGGGMQCGVSHGAAACRYITRHACAWEWWFAAPPTRRYGDSTQPVAAALVVLLSYQG
jgi:hypothetical protein